MVEAKPVKEVVTVAAMARMCGLSRSRFYGLIKEGIMPSPSRNPTTKRPFFSREQQEQCLLVRKTNCGINGRPILFYANKWSREPAAPTRPIRSAPTARRTQGRPQRSQVDPIIEEIRDGLGQLGVADATEMRIRTALADTYPDGHENVATATLLMTVFRGLNRQDTPDNVAR